MHKNVVYGNIKANGDVFIANRTYNIEQDFPYSVLFLRIEKSNVGHEVMLSIKSKVDTPLPLLHQTVQLLVSDDLFSHVNGFQNSWRSIDSTLRGVGLEVTLPKNDETALAEAIHTTFFSGDIGTVCNDFLNLLQTGKIKELLLVISTEDERIQNLPWEMVLPKLAIGDGDGLPKNNFGLIRSREKTLQRFNIEGPTVEAAPLKMLFIPALPENLSERSKLLEIEDEQRKIIEAVRSLEATGDQQPKLVMEILDSANLEEIKEALEKRSHDIVHISGHGAYVESMKAGILCLEDENGNEQQIKGYELGLALRQFSSIKLLVLSACETAVGGPEGSTAEQIAAVGIPAVLAMRFSVTDKGAKLFTETLYQRLTAGDTLTKAVHDARQRLWKYVQQRRKEAPHSFTPAEWFTPVLYQNQAIHSLVKPGQYNKNTLGRFYPKAAFLRGSYTRLVGEGFIGRKRLLIQLRQYVSAGKHVCLYGLGGLGKTTTVEAFADLYRKRNGHDILFFRYGPEIQEAVILEKIYKRWKSQVKPDDDVADELKAQIDNPENAPEAKLQLLIDNCLYGRRNILIFDNFEDVQTTLDGTQEQEIVSEGLRTFIRYLLQKVPPTCHLLFTTRYHIAHVEGLITHLAVDKMTYAEQYRYINFSQTLRAIPAEQRDILDRRINGHPRALQFLEGLIQNDRTFDLTQFDDSIGQVERRIFENLLLARLYTQLSPIQKEVFSVASVFFSRSPLAALSATTDKQADELIPILTALRDWSLCFWDEKEQVFEVHALTRAWMRQLEIPDQNQFKEVARRAGVFFRDWEESTWSDEELAKDYFEQAESWEEYTAVVWNLQSFYWSSGFYNREQDLLEYILAKNISPETNAIAELSLGLIFKLKGDSKLALNFFYKSLYTRKQIGDLRGQCNSLNSIAVIYDVLGNYEKALEYYRESLKISKEDGYLKGQADSLNGIGTVCIALGDTKLGLEYLHESLSFYEQTNDVDGQELVFNNLGAAYKQQDDLEHAEEYYLKCWKIIESEKQNSTNAAKLVTLLINLGEISFARGELENVIEALDSCLILLEKFENIPSKGVVLENLGWAYLKLSDFKPALTYFEESLAIRNQVGDTNGKVSVMLGLGFFYHKQFEMEEENKPWLVKILKLKSRSTTLTNAFYYTFTAYSIAKQTGFALFKSAETLAAVIHGQLAKGEFEKIVEQVQSEIG